VVDKIYGKVEAKGAKKSSRVGKWEIHVEIL